MNSTCLHFLHHIRHTLFDKLAAPSFIFSIRFVIALIALFGYAVQYMQRINMSVAIVCMVNSTALTQQKDAADLSRLAQLGSDAKSLNQSNQALADSQCRFQPQKGAKSLV